MLVTITDSGDESDAKRLAGELLVMAASKAPHVERLTNGSLGMLSLAAGTVKHGEVRRMPAAQRPSKMNGASFAT